MKTPKDADNVTKRTAFAGSDDFLSGAFTHYVNDVQRAMNLVGHYDGPMSCLTLDLLRMTDGEL